MWTHNFTSNSLLPIITYNLFIIAHNWISTLWLKHPHLYKYISYEVLRNNWILINACINCFVYDIFLGNFLRAKHLSITTFPLFHELLPMARILRCMGNRYVTCIQQLKSPNQWQQELIKSNMFIPVQYICNVKMSWWQNKLLWKANLITHSMHIH